MIRLLARLKRKSEPLLSDSEMAELYEEIFDEPVSAEALFAKFRAVPHDRRHLHEWVMDRRTLNRIRRTYMPTPMSGSALNMRSVAEMFVTFADERLLGLPVAIEPGAKLSLRERAS